MGGRQQTSTEWVMERDQQWVSSRSKTINNVSEGSLVLSSHHLYHIPLSLTALPCSSTWPLVSSSSASHTSGLSHAGKNMDQHLDKESYMQMNHLMEITSASHLQIILVTISKRITRGYTCWRTWNVMDMADLYSVSAS
jgi:hypothetical protein